MTEHLPGMEPANDMPEWLRSHHSTCRSCGALIVWAMTRVDGARTMPVDPVPNPRGNVKLWVDGGTLRAAVDPSAGVLYLSHFATCPHADRHRRKITATTSDKIARTRGRT